ncbi:hypothetical protein [Flavobacterium tegetincola]|uniref:hypothetical protein n=1 Tax=Flavobacterium tegetincola TaxID=150172 RepID=UPI0004048890|nr:hypothetical protein [Flavobacterium tegetincola]
MKKLILSASVVLISFTSMAQKQPMLGKWIEQKRSFVDTLDTGRDLVNAEYEAYSTGQKTLDAQYISILEFNAVDTEKLNLNIWKENNSIYLAANGDLKNKVALEPKKGSYFLTYYGRKYEIVYDSKNEKLRLVNPKYKMDFYEFTSKI